MTKRSDDAQGGSSPPTQAELSARAEDGRSLVRLGRRHSAEVSARLRALSPQAVLATLQTVRPEQRAELLEHVEQIDAVVPLLPEAEFAATIVGAGVADAGWLLAHATPSQRVAAVDFDCWRDEKFSPHRARDWVDALIDAGEATLVAAFDELDPELWVLILRSMARFGIPGMTLPEDGWEDAGTSLDGHVYFDCDDSSDEERVRKILETARIEAPDSYWRLVYGAMLENTDECQELAVRWYRGRLSDLGFPERERALEAYRPTDVDLDALRRATAPPAPRSGAGAIVATGPFEGTGLGRALRDVPARLAHEVVRHLLALANMLAVADGLPLAEPGSVDRSLRKALRGVSRGLEEIARASGRRPSLVLAWITPLDLFRVGVEHDPELRPRMPAPPRLDDPLDASLAEDWDVVQEMISAADRSLGPDGRPR